MPFLYKTVLKYFYSRGSRKSIQHTEIRALSMSHEVVAILKDSAVFQSM